ncbi:virulence-associated e family protein [Elizabethkingia anophelis]|uniref:VapE domain-containing protein n=1 Tax=Elizabethkingia anophelis TaxID=1117645 RepID=UPI000CE9ACDD|nr:VapE domain-containing protein [Elizabethkingia anophelis]AVF47864.1 virulence-associated e family protein [Elizabethkingia anophelis]AVF51856.1 virulence-associated e family protein [Elizabethkingia anophelis]MBG0505461.1 virulence-associated e family protein [Elizabethkingia anophelis]MCT4074322.1 virulence-associated e family protein [Elizabethkingia anophelis]MDV3569020.1 virulence-associated e family protein [Elizabethkingia anophelis]
MTITEQNKDKEQLNIETFQKCVIETDKDYEFIDGQKDNYVRTLADHCNQNGIPIDKAKILIKEKHNFDDELVTKIINKEYSDKKAFGIANKKSIETFLNETYKFRYNEVLGKIEVQIISSAAYKPLDDYGLNSICRILEVSGYKTSPQKLHNLLVSDFTPRYNPFKEYLINLPKWDGKDYIKEFSDLVTTDDKDFWKEALTKWLVALIACSTDNAIMNQSVIVLNGGQGVGKSRFISKILPPELRDYKYSGTINPHNKDSLILLSEKILIDLDELGSLNRKDEKAMKELITKADVQLRKPYGRITETLPRRASFIGSVNDGEFLMDMTGNRRFLCFEATKIDYDSEINYQGLYSQILHLYTSGFKYWFDGDEIRKIDEKNEKFRAKNPIEELILSEYTPCAEELADDFLSSTQILHNLREKHSISLDTSNSIAVGKIMKKHGFLKVKKENIYKYAIKNN